MRLDVIDADTDKLFTIGVDKPPDAINLLDAGYSQSPAVRGTEQIGMLKTARGESVS